MIDGRRYKSSKILKHIKLADYIAKPPRSFHPICPVDLNVAMYHGGNSKILSTVNEHPFFVGLFLPALSHGIWFDLRGHELSCFSVRLILCFQLFLQNLTEADLSVLSLMIQLCKTFA